MSTTICIATYGAERWRELAKTRAYPSAMAQMGQGCEIHYTHIPDGGTLAQARNSAAGHAKGDWLVFLDADDELEPGYVAAMERAARSFQGEYALLVPRVRYVYGRRKPAAKFPKEIDLRDGNWLVIGTGVQRSLFELVGGFREWPLYEDWCLWQRCEKAGAAIVKVPDAVYTAHAATRSRNRAPGRNTRLQWHDAIRRANFPELYEEELV